MPDMSRFRLLLAGATGAVGREVLRLALESEQVDELVAITRRPLPTETGLENPVVDFGCLPEKADWWAVDGVICALGTTRRQAGSRKAFAFVDRDLPAALARQARAAGASRFALVSSVGANPRGNFYLRTKAEAENAVRAVGFPRLVIVRPSLIDTHRADSRPAELLTLTVSRPLRFLIPRRYRPVKPGDIARTLLQAVLNHEPADLIIESEAIG